MIINPDNKGSLRNPMTKNMRLAVLGLCISSVAYLAKTYTFPTPFEINPSEFANYVSSFTLTLGIIKVCASKAPLPLEVEQYMIDNAIRFRREGLAESLTSIVSLLVTNKDYISSLLK